MCWLVVSCSSSKKLHQQAFTPVQFTEEQQLEYEFNFMEATKLKLLGNLPDAASKLTWCVEANPYDAAAYFQLAEIYVAVDDQENALKNARLANRYDPNNTWYLTQLANLYVIRHETDSAIIAYRKLIDQQPNNVELHSNLSILYLENNQYKKALKQLKYVERITGFTEEVAIAQYQIYLKKHDEKAVEKVLKKSVEIYPDELIFYGLLAELYSAIGKEQEAQSYYTKLLQVDPENALGYVSMIEFYKEYGNDAKAMEETQRMYGIKTIDPDLKVDLFLSLSSDSVFFGKHTQELDQLSKMLFEMHPDNIRVRLLDADRNIHEKNFEEAKNALLYVTDRIQTNSYLWERLFDLLYFLQDYETLYEKTGKALEFFADNYMFRFFHGLSASMLDKHDEAIVAYLTTLEQLRKEKDYNKEVEIQSYAMLGEAYNAEKRYSDSDFVYEKALSLDPNNVMVLNNYSYYLSLRNEKLDLAEKYIKRCIAKEPNSSTYLDTYGWVLYKLGRIDEAIAAIKKAMDHGGADNPEIIDHMCELLTVSGQTDEAYHVCKYALELNNSEEPVEQKMKSILENHKK